MPLNFRHPEQTDWCQGTATNISSSGVLFHADQTLKVHTPIQLRYVLPNTIAGKSSLAVHCKGEIVRSETPAAKEGTFLFAVKILDFYPSAQK
jgi:PilZ domain